MLNFALFGESDSTSKRYFFLREVSTAHTCAGGEHTHRAFHIRCYVITVGHGRRPAMRVSERVRPTADLAPLTIQAAGQWAEASHEGLRTGPPQLTPLTHSRPRKADFKVSTWLTL